MRRLLRPPYLYFFIFIFLSYLFFNILFSGFLTTAKLVLIYAKSVDWLKLGLSLVLTLLIGFFVTVNAIYFFIAYRQRKQCKEGKVLAGAGTLGGLAVGVCPLCVAGGFPLLLSLLGISFSFGSLPFGGIEIQIVVLGILVWSYMLMKKRVVI